MLDYARISKILEYQRQGVWPLNRPHLVFLICTYDTILNAEVVYGGTPEWGTRGWHYLDDNIDYLQMPFKNPATRRISREEIMLDEDASFVPPDLYFLQGYGSGFERFSSYHRLTSVGFVLVNKEMQ